MSTQDKKKSEKQQDATRLKSAQKQAQLSEALRANLRRRKEQARGRKDSTGDDQKS